MSADHICTSLSNGANGLDWPFFGHGTAGVALCLTLIGRETSNEEYALRGTELLLRSFVSLTEQPVSLSLLSGISGIALTGRLIATHYPDIGASLPRLDELEDVIVEALSAGVAGGDFDLAEGLSGVGLLAPHIPDPARRQRVCRLVVEGLQSSAQGISPNKLAWPTSNSAYRVRETADDLPEYNVGMAHGLTGVLSSLLGMRRAGFVDDDLDRLISQSLDTLLGCIIASPDGSFVPEILGAEDPARIGWCYGNLPAVAVLIGCARIFPERSQRCLQSADDLLKFVSNSVTSSSRLNDLWICHGLGGLLMQLDRLWSYTHWPLLGQIYHLTFKRAVPMVRQHAEVIAGDQTNAGILLGWAGLALVLHGLARPDVDWWSDALLPRVF